MSSATCEHVIHVVADQEDGQPAVGQPADQVENLLGLRDTERRGRLVEDDDAWSSTAPHVAMATVCRCPPDRLATCWRIDFTRADRQAVERLAGPLLHVCSSSRPTLGDFAAEEHVLDDVEVVAQREVLVHDLDARGRCACLGVVT